MAENGAKTKGGLTVDPITIVPIKIEYGARISDEFLYASEDAQLDYMSAFADGFAKKVAKGLDLMAFHGVNPRTGTASSVIGTNHFDSKVTQAVTIASGVQADENLRPPSRWCRAQTGRHRHGAGPALQVHSGQADHRRRRKALPQLAWGANPGEVNGLRVESTSNLSSGSSLDRALVGDFVNCFKWGYAKEIPIEVIRYGNPDNDTQLGDLKGHNQVYLRGEAYIGWGILDRPPSPTSRPASKEDMTMLYRNKKTGAVIETDCLISGGDWESDRADAAPDATSEADTEADPPAAKSKRKGRATV